LVERSGSAALCFVTEHRVETDRDSFDPLVGLAHEIRRHLVVLQSVMQPRGPLAARLLVGLMSIADERSVANTKAVGAAGRG